MPFYPKNGKKFVKKAPRKRAYAKKALPSKSLTKMVQKIIHKDAETKQAFTNTVSQIQLFNSGINSSGDIQLLMPSVAIGANDYQRIGDQIRAQSLTIKGHFISRFVTTNGATYFNNCRIGVRMFIVRPKSYPSQGQLVGNASTWQGILLRKGGTTTGFTGLISDLYAPVNTDAITCLYDKTFYVQNPYSNGLITADPNLVMPTGTTKFFSKTIKLNNKLLKYDTGIDSGLTPVDYNPVLIIGYSYLDGSTADAVSTQIGMSFTSLLNYEDM